MEQENIKLENIEKGKKQAVEKIVYAIAMCYVLYMSLKMMIKIGFSISSMIFTLLIGFGFGGVLYLITERYNIDYKYLKEKGKKIEGRIIGIGDNIEDIKHNYYIVIEYNGKRKNIKKMKRNEAYKILEKMITKYSVEEIPIDIYKKGLFIYADLESVKLSKIKE